MAQITLFRDKIKELIVDKPTLIDCSTLGIYISFDNVTFRKVLDDLQIAPGTIYLKTKEESVVIDYQEIGG